MRITIKLSVGFALLAQLIFKSGLLFAQNPELLKKLEQYPDSLELHQEFIEQAKSNMDTLISQYEKLREKFPASPTIPYALGKALFYRSHPEARRWLEYALEADSNQAEVYMLYGIDAGRWGDYQLGTVYF